MRIAICDDEMIWVEEIKQQILNLNYEEMMEVKIECFTNQEEMLNRCHKVRFNIVFLDIEMDGKNGIEVAKILREFNSNCVIVFVTAYDSYVTDAFRLSALQYISKPINEKDFKIDFERAVKAYKKADVMRMFKMQDGYKSININEIICVESYYNTTRVRTTRGIYMTNYANLRKIRKEILDYDFIRIQAGYIVNMHYIVGLKYREVELVTGQVLPVSMTGFNRIAEKYNRFLNEQEE